MKYKVMLEVTVGTPYHAHLPLEEFREELVHQCIESAQELNWNWKVTPVAPETVCETEIGYIECVEGETTQSTVKYYEELGDLYQMGYVFAEMLGCGATYFGFTEPEQLEWLRVKLGCEPSVQKIAYWCRKHLSLFATGEQ